MNKKQLIDALENLSIQAHRSHEEKFFIRMVRQVWQIDWSVTLSIVWHNLMSQNKDYFLSFMALDDGDEREENWLVDFMDENVKAFIGKTSDSDWKVKFIATIDELNKLRFKMQK